MALDAALPANQINWHVIFRAVSNELRQTGSDMNALARCQNSSDKAQVTAHRV
jgi:hypothetical protein